MHCTFIHGVQAFSISGLEAIHVCRMLYTQQDNLHKCSKSGLRFRIAEVLMESASSNHFSLLRAEEHAMSEGRTISWVWSMAGWLSVAFSILAKMDMPFPSMSCPAVAGALQLFRSRACRAAPVGQQNVR